MKTTSSNFIHKIAIIALVLGLAWGLTINVSAAEPPCTWTGSVDTDWRKTGNWSCGHVPTQSDDVVIPGGVTNYPLINYSDKYVAYANNLTIQSGAMLLVSERLELLANNVDNYGVIKTEGMDSTYIRGYTSINNYGIINAYAGTISIHYGGTHTGTFTGQWGEIVFAGQNFYDHTFSASSQIRTKKVSFIFNKPIDIKGIFSQTYPDSRVIIDNSHVSISNLTNLSIGAVTIVSGSLEVRLSGTTSGAVSVPENSSFVGTGTVSGDLTNAGTVSPGASPGTIAVEGDYAQETTGILKIELGGTTPDTDYDQLTVTGTATLDGTLQVSLIDPFTPAVGDSFTIMTYASHTGTFDAINLPELGPDLTWQLDYEDTALVLRVSSTGGSITGTVFYDGSLPLSKIEVNAFSDDNPAPYKKGDIVEVGADYIAYIINDLTPADYFVSAFVDIDGDGGPPLPYEPVGWYDHDSDGVPNAVQVQDGETTSDINITLTDPVLRIFLPLILR